MDKLKEQYKESMWMRLDLVMFMFLSIMFMMSVRDKNHLIYTCIVLIIMAVISYIIVIKFFPDCLFSLEQLKQIEYKEEEE